MKKLILLLILAMGVNTQAEAQFFKKLGNAIDKAAKTVDKAANTVLGDSKTSNNSNNEPKAAGKPYLIGETKVTVNGQNMPDIIISDLSAARIYSDTRVLLNFQLNNTSKEYSYSFNLGIGDNDATVFVDASGNQYSHGWTDLGEHSFTLYDCTNNCKILDDTKLNCRMLIVNVPTRVTAFKRGELYASYFGPHDSWPNNISYRLDNIPIKLRPCLQRDGVHGEADILIGSTIASLPNAVDSIYDSYTVQDYEFADKACKLVTFTLENEPVLYALSYDHSTLALMILEVPHISFKVGEHYYRIGSNLRDDDARFCTKQGEKNLVFKDMLIVTQDGPKGYDDVITCVYAGSLPQ